MSSADKILPNGFESLEKHVDYWARTTEAERRVQRDNSNIDDIKSFYEDMSRIVDSALDYLNTRDFNAFDEAETRLFSLTLALAEIAPAVDWYNQVRVIDGVVPERYEIDMKVRNRLAREANERIFI